MPRLTVPAAEIRLADVIELQGIGAYGCATVKNIVDGKITVFRPYVSTSDFIYTGGVICTIGIEEFTLYPRPGESFMVVERKELR